jgi:hypothetical protein
LRFRPKGRSHAEVQQHLEQGHRARLVPVVALKVVAAPDEPPVLVQAYEPLTRCPGTQLWLWSDGTLRAAPEYVVMDSPFDRVWVIASAVELPIDFPN